MSILLIIPYFGKLPNYFKIFLKTVEFNKSVNFLIYTDDKTKYNYPENVEVIYTTFADFKKIVQKNFDFEISLSTPYKLCDYKPAYGDILKDKIRNFDYWGHCDIDLVFGNIRKFISDDILRKYRKICYLGHLTLYKNDDDTNSIYKSDDIYKRVYTTDDVLAFDESFEKDSVNNIFINKNIPIYNEMIFADISPLYYDFRLYRYEEYNFQLEKKNNQIFIWDNGTLTGVINDRYEEFCYVHFQKRRLEIRDNLGSKFKIVPNKITTIDDTYNKHKIFYKPFFQLKFKAFKNKFRR